MNLSEALEVLQSIKEPTEVDLSPGPFIANCNWQDAVAAKLLVWMLQEMPEDATYGNAERVLTSALWWLQFFIMQPRKNTNESL